MTTRGNDGPRARAGSWGRLGPLAAMVFGAVLVAGACDDGSTGPPDGVVELRFDLTTGNEGWTGGFADFPEGREEQLELTVERRALPEELPIDGSAFFISGRNTSDDLFMFLKRKIAGLEPDRRHALEFTVELASNAPSGCAGIGGPPGEAVTVKAGATRVEPEPIVVDGDVRMNVDKGNQSSGGEAAVVLGDVATGPGDCTNPEWRTKTLESPEPFVVTADENGEVWLLVGTDSGFEGTTGLFYLTIEVTARPQ